MRHATRLLEGRYRLVDLLAQGGVADVYRAVDESSGEIVAVKILRMRDLQLARRLEREVELLGRLHHPGLVRLIGSGALDGHGYLVMELLDGGSLEDRLRHGPLAPAEAAEVVSTLAVGLDHVHAAGVVHRDVKPANVLFDAAGVAHLGDFGIAQWTDRSTLTSNGTTLGTASYMAPEQLHGGTVGPPADVWALGVVALETLTGRRLFEGTGVEVIARRLAGPVPVPADIPDPWYQLVSDMTRELPEERPGAAAVAARTAGASFRAPAGRGAAGIAASTAPWSVSAGGRGPAPATAWPATVSTAQVPKVTGPPSRRRRGRRVVASSAVVAAILAASAGFAWSYAGAGSSARQPAAYVRPARRGPASTATTATTTTTSTTTTTAPSTTTTAAPPPPPPPPPPTTAPPLPPPPHGPGRSGGGPGPNH